MLPALRGHSEQDPSAPRTEILGGFYSASAVFTVPHTIKLTVMNLKVGYERAGKGPGLSWSPARLIRLAFRASTMVYTTDSRPLLLMQPAHLPLVVFEREGQLRRSRAHRLYPASRRTSTRPGIPSRSRKVASWARFQYICEQ